MPRSEYGHANYSRESQWENSKKKKDVSFSRCKLVAIVVAL
jgi:hypothetical protein